MVTYSPYFKQCPKCGKFMIPVMITTGGTIWYCNICDVRIDPWTFITFTNKTEYLKDPVAVFNTERKELKE